MLVVVIVAAVVGSFVLMRPPPATRIALTPMTNDANSPQSGGYSSITPDWPTRGANFVDFSSWSSFGGVDAQFTDNGRTAFLNTHDTTDTWHTKWSGLIQEGEPLCAFRLTGRVRDASHTVGVPGGLGIGTAELGSGDPAEASLTGSAIQFDFGQNGYRLAVYPSDNDNGLVPAALDNQWHDIDLTVDDKASTLLVDGRLAAKALSPGQCGHPVIRVWAGAAEFTGFRFAT